MKHLAKRRDIIITTANKGGTVIIMDTENYINEANHELSNKNNCKILQTDPTLQHNKMVNDTPNRSKNENPLSKKIAEGLKGINPKTPKCFIAPKIHKENNLGRPVINPINCHISRFVDHHLQPLVKEIPSCIKGINDFVNKGNNFKVPENLFLVTMDVKASYTNTKQQRYCCFQTKTHQLHKENRSQKK